MIQIVPIRKEHIRGFREILDQVAREEKHLLLLKAPSLENVRGFVLSNIQNKFTHFVALDGEKIVGWCDMIPFGHPTTKHIGKLGMGLLAPYRGKGIGKKLMEACLGHAKSRGLETVYLEVYGSNRRAIALYRKLRFKTDGIRERGRKHKGRYEDLILMSKRLR